MYKRQPAKGLTAMEKRVPKNEKYSGVKGTLDTGMTVAKVKFVTAREYSQRRDEIFYRLTKGQLHSLLNEYEREEFETIRDSGKADDSVRIVTYSESEEPVYDKPYLILDVRDGVDFNDHHIQQARSFPYTMLRRDQMIPEIYSFRNKPETLIIICCADEKISRDSAKMLVDRGIDNVFLLTGGINEFAYEFPEFIEGIPPRPPKGHAAAAPTGTRGPRTSSLTRIQEDGSGIGSPTDRGTLTPGKLQRHNETYANKGGRGSASRQGSGGYGGPAAGAHQFKASRQSSGGGGGGRDAYSESGATAASNKSVAESIISRAASRKGRF